MNKITYPVYIQNRTLSTVNFHITYSFIPNHVGKSKFALRTANTLN